MPTGVYIRTKKPIFTEEHRQKLSVAKLGIKNPMFGKKSWNSGTAQIIVKKENPHNKGVPRSEETKLKISKILISKQLRHSKKSIEKNRQKHLGKKASQETKDLMSRQRKGRVGYWLGKHPSLETRIKLSEARKGDKCHLWRGGITKENMKARATFEYTLWREAVFARDNWTCQKTGERGGKLVAHHIENFSSKIELRTSIYNGITLSQKSHQLFHKIYGVINNTKEQLIEFLNNTNIC